LSMIDIAPDFSNVHIDLLHFLRVILVDCIFHHVVGLIDAGQCAFHVLHPMQCGQVRRF
jgi:hypothetical protein